MIGTILGTRRLFAPADEGGGGAGETTAVAQTPLEALLDASGLTRGETETGEDFSKRVYEKVKDVSEEDWEKLSDTSEEAATWHNAYHTAATEGSKKLPLIPGVSKGAPKAAKAPRAAAAARQPREKKEKKERPERGSWLIREIVLTNPSVKPDELQSQLAAKQIAVTPSTCSTTRASFMRSVEFLRGKGLLNEDALLKLSANWKTATADEGGETAGVEAAGGTGGTRRAATAAT